MPIRRELRWLYPIDWPQFSALVRFGRARGRCERCGRPHGRTVHHLGDGRWWDAEAETWRDGRGREVAPPAYAEYSGCAGPGWCWRRRTWTTTRATTGRATCGRCASAAT